MKLDDCRGFHEAVNGACTCGGGGPPDYCPSCEVYHAIKDFEVVDEKAKTLADMVAEHTTAVMAKRNSGLEEMVKTFLAETGAKVEDCELVERMGKTGDVTWTIRRKSTP